VDQSRLNRIRFRAWRRGFREADLILGPFADRYAPSMSQAEISEMEKMNPKSPDEMKEEQEEENFLKGSPAPAPSAAHH